MTNNISNRLANTLIKNGATVIDIRDEKDFGVSHIPGAINININDLNDLNKLCLNKVALIIVVCYKGIKSAVVAQKLNELGYENVYNLTDGYDNFKTFFD